MTKANDSLNIIALTQGSSIDIFLNVIQGIRSLGYNVEKVGALVSFARHFKRSKVVEEFSGKVTFLKEWEIVGKALESTADLERLRKKEHDYSAAAVWSAMLADRRMIYGRRSKYRQDYRVHYTDAQLWSIAWQFIAAFEDMLDRIKPDVIIGFTPVTFGEMLGLEIASSRGIPILHLHSSRIENFFALYDTVYGASSHFQGLIKKNRFQPETRARAVKVMDEAARQGLIYEGVDLAISSGRPFRPLECLRPLAGALYNERLRMKDPELRNDRHDPGAFVPWLYQYWVQPARERIVKARLRSHPRHIELNELKMLGSYAFYPLHSEPEVALQVLGRPYHKNQIELIRNLAASLPAGMKLVVKEHPRSMGLRPYSYYKALWEIPNLYMMDAHCPSNPVVKESEFVAVISGTIGFEAIMMQKPVLILGHPRYEDVPGRMTRKCYNLFDLPDEIRALLKGYAFDAEKLEAFICALIEGSVAIDLYSNLLKKPGRKSFQDGAVSVEDDLKKLAAYTIRRIEEARE